jgi:hypothetical protein
MDDGTAVVAGACRAEDWGKKTEEALEARRPLDAMVYYQKLLGERGASAALGVKMRSMWLELGGSAESWDAYLKYAPLVRVADGAEWNGLEPLPKVELEARRAAAGVVT